jgi:hypothetical protein
MRCALWSFRLRQFGNVRYLAFLRPLYPPKADMCSALAHVCFGQIADICCDHSKAYCSISTPDKILLVIAWPVRGSRDSI